MSVETAVGTSPEEPEDNDDSRECEGGATEFTLSVNSTGNSGRVTLTGLGGNGGCFGSPFGGATGVGGVIGIGGYPGYPYSPQTPYIPWAPPHQPGIVFPPPPYITPNDVVKGEFKMTDEEQEKLVKFIFDLYRKEDEKKKAEEEMVKKDKSRFYPDDDPIMEPDPEASDRVYKIPYASGGLVGHPKVPTALHGLFYAMWIFASWVTLKPAILTVAAAKTAWKVPVFMYRGAAHAFYVTLPPAVLLILAALCLSGPRWVEPLMNWSGWGYDRHGDWVGFVLIFTFSLLGAAVWTIFHFAYRAAEHHWWWQEQK